MDILDNNENVIDGTTATPVPSEDGQANDVVYEYSIWADPGRKFTFVPRDSRYAQV